MEKNCFKCSSEFESANKYIECNVCKNCFHPECTRLKNNKNLRKLGQRKATWKCEDCIMTKKESLNDSSDSSENTEDTVKALKEFIDGKTGFQLRPVAGYLSPRDFLSGLAFRVFHCTQYIRHSSDPYYTPEPDCCHELLGHMPLLANPSFAQFSQELGLTSLGAADDDIEKLATLYFFTVEFGLCKQDDTLKVYGAGLLSSVAELKHALTAEEKIKRFDPEVTCHEECIITSYQNSYYYTDSFEEATEKMREFASTIKRPFGVRYNPYTQSVEVLSNAKKIAALVSELRGDLCIVSNALKKIHEQDETVDVEGIANMLHCDLHIDTEKEKNDNFHKT